MWRIRFEDRDTILNPIHGVFVNVLNSFGFSTFHVFFFFFFHCCSLCHYEEDIGLLINGVWVCVCARPFVRWTINQHRNEQIEFNWRKSYFCSLKRNVYKIKKRFASADDSTNLCLFCFCSVFLLFIQRAIISEEKTNTSNQQLSVWHSSINLWSFGIWNSVLRNIYHVCCPAVVQCVHMCVCVSVRFDEHNEKIKSNISQLKITKRK